MCKYLSLIFFLSSITACKSAKFNDSDRKATCRPVVQDSAIFDAVSDPFTIIRAVINGNCLMIDVEYSGGCGDVEFTLVWNGAMMKSLPPQVPIKLHLVDKDYCRSIIRKSFCFNVNQVYDGDFVILLKDYEGRLMFTKKK